MELRGDSSTGYAHKSWVQISWSEYNETNGETRPSVGDIDGDGMPELVVGLGTGSGGWIEIFDDAKSGYAHLAWTRVSFDDYNKANGETRPLVVDIDGDGKKEIVVGLGKGGNGWIEILGDASSGYAHKAWLQVPWAGYNSGNGSVLPAIHVPTAALAP